MLIAFTLLKAYVTFDGAMVGSVVTPRALGSIPFTTGENE
jgi:hypothetical protein